MFLATPHTGTPGYSPPETLDGATKSTNDLFGLVATFVKLATGNEPFGDAVQSARSKEQPSLPDELFGAEEQIRRSIARTNERADREHRAVVNSLKAEIATHIRSEDWTQVDSVAEKLLEIVPDDGDPKTARELASQRPFPDDGMCLLL